MYLYMMKLEETYDNYSFTVFVVVTVFSISACIIILHVDLRI